jgi:hypothetical protein
MTSPDITFPCTILVVDDHQDSADSIALLINHHGYKTATAYSFDEAVEKCRNQKFDLLITDLELKMNDGVELFKQLKKEHGVKAIACSGHSEEGDIQRAIDAGFIDYLIKPMRAEVVFAAIEKALQI